jgi:hypothetical protein
MERCLKNSNAHFGCSYIVSTKVTVDFTRPFNLEQSKSDLQAAVSNTLQEAEDAMVKMWLVQSVTSPCTLRSDLHGLAYRHRVGHDVGSYQVPLSHQ